MRVGLPGWEMAARLSLGGAGREAGEPAQPRVLEIGSVPLIMAPGRGALVEPVVVGDDKTALAARQRLAGHDRHGTDVADGAEKPALVDAAVRVRNVLD